MENEEKKIVNLFEDNGNFHDEKELQKSLEKMSQEDKKYINTKSTTEHND